MKNLVAKLFTAFICLSLTVAIIPFQGCKGTPKTAAYKTLKSVSDSVDSAMKAAAEARVKGVLTAENWTKIAELHEQYRVAFSNSIAAAQFNYENAPPAEVAGLAAELTALVASYLH